MLRDEEERLQGQQKEGDNVNVRRRLSEVREEISMMEDLITRRMIASMIRAAPDVQRGMEALARLDAVFARASFGLDWGGVVPEVMGIEGRVHVRGFVHPVLAVEREPIITDDDDDRSGSGGDPIVPAVVPVDLVLPGRGGYRALVISGPNGGGKTLALKSFGLVAMMAKLGLPITTTTALTSAGCSPGDGTNGNEGGSGSPPAVVVDFFEDVLVEVGDRQNIGRGESTLTARLNALSGLIRRLSNDASLSNRDVDSGGAMRLVLLDELGGGTDPVAGGALARSILEKIISSGPGCKLIATTHSPQLKALSVGDDAFECASVLMGEGGSPAFRLSYGTTGESHALEAARRCRPRLPDDVINRAAELMDSGDGDVADSLRLYLSALDRERRDAKELAEATEAKWKEVSDYKNDMLGKIQVSRMQLSRLESRLESIFDTLRNDETRSSYELVGDSLQELRLLRRRVQTEEELLSEKGLRRVPDSYSFYEGETVVIIAEGEWKGYDAVVKATNDPLTVTVVPVLDLFATDEDDAQQSLVLGRRSVAIFDYPDWGLSDGNSSTSSGPFPKEKESGSKVLGVLSSLNTSGEIGGMSNPIKTKDKEKTTFTSARQRKAITAAAKSATKQKKGSKGKERK